MCARRFTLSHNVWNRSDWNSLSAARFDGRGSFLEVADHPALHCGTHGFTIAGWIDTDVIGINAGIILLSAENMRTAKVWRWFMQNREIPLAMQRVGLRATGARASHKQAALIEN